MGRKSRIANRYPAEPKVAREQQPDGMIQALCSTQECQTYRGDDDKGIIGESALDATYGQAQLHRMEPDEKQSFLSCAVTRMQIPVIRTTCAASLLPLLLLLTLPATVPAQDYTSTANKGTITTGATITNPDSTIDTDPTEIKTLDGVTYKPVRIVRVMPDGLVVGFTPRGGGVGMAKLRFENLPADLRQRYSHDAARAAELAQGQAKLAAQYWADYKDATNRIAIQLAKQEAEERAEAERVRIAKEKADAELRRSKEEKKVIDAMATVVQGRDETNRPPSVKPAGPY